jgi:mannosylglycerate hydrolase
MARQVSVVPHTHWDREWYLPYQSFRLRLVSLLDDLLPRLERDPAFRHFLLDGQLAAVDDYLEVRPEAESRLRRLVASGRVAVGPWYTLPDEFLVSGETLVRDLEMGLERAAALGGAMMVGYLPDMFGHVAQMPQLLRGFGFEHAVVWRGVPAAIDRTAFWWEAPDGSRVRAEYLPTGYGNGALVPDDPKRFLDRVAGWVAEHDAKIGDAPVLWMAGSDHEVPAPHLPQVVADATMLSAGELEMGITSLAEHLALAPTEDLPHWQGELRSGARANLLMGVASNRVDVKQAAARAERWLERVAEPLCAVYLPHDEVAVRLLARAWRLVVLNAAHDSVCACSHDEVVASVLDRYAQARQIAEGLAGRALRSLAGSLWEAGPVVVNTTARPRGGVVELVVPGAEAPPGTQLVEALGGRREAFDLPASSAVAVLGEIVGWTPGLSGAEVRAVDEEVEVELHLDGRPGDPPDRSSVTAMLEPLVEGRPEARVRAWLVQPPLVRVLARAEAVPGFGHAPLAAGERPAHAVTAEGHRLANGLLTVDVAADGTFALGAHGGLGRLVDGGDAGDTYNWCPPRHDVLVEGAERVVVAEATGGPVEGSVTVRATYRWPVRSDLEARSADTEPVEVVTRIVLRAGERFVRVSHAFTNRCTDHRLRVHLPLPAPAATSRAECAFGLVERGLHAEGGPTEPGLATYPSRRFVQAGGLTVAHEGLLEYELVGERDGAAHELALTLLRATRMLSQKPMSTRPLPAGPLTELQGSQSLGPHELRYVVGVGDVDPFALADDAFTPLLVTPSLGQGEPAAGGHGWRCRRPASGPVAAPWSSRSSRARTTDAPRRAPTR